MRVLILSQYCWPEIDHKCLPLAKAIRDKGFKVEILTAYPSRPTGKIYPNYKKKLFQREYEDGIKINRVPSYLDHSHSGIKRMMSYISFAISSSIIGQFLIKKPDIIYAYHAPATIAIPAIYLKFIFKSKILYDINDYWPDTIIELGMLKNKYLVTLLIKYCTSTYKYFDKINVVSLGYKKKLLELGVPEYKISLIYNWSLPINNIRSNLFDKFENIFKNNFTILYAGNIGQAQNLQIILDAADIIKQKNITGIKFFLVGSGVETEFLEKEVALRKLEDFIMFTGFIPSENVGQFLESADVLFLHLRRIPLFKITIPSKLVSYFISKKPVLCGVEGESSDIVQEAKAGFCFESENAQDLSEKIIAFKEIDRHEMLLMGRSGRNVYDSLFSFEMGTSKLIEEFEKLTKN